MYTRGYIHFNWPQPSLAPTLVPHQFWGVSMPARTRKMKCPYFLPIPPKTMRKAQRLWECVLLLAESAGCGGVRGSGGCGSRDSGGAMPSAVPGPECWRNRYNGLACGNVLVSLVCCATRLSGRPEIFTCRVCCIGSGVVVLIGLVAGVGLVAGWSIGLGAGLLWCLVSGS